MLLETAILAGALFGFGLYLMLQASFVRVLFGFVLLSNAANLVVLAMFEDGADTIHGVPLLTRPI